MGIEPTLEAWEATVLPLNYTRIAKADTGAVASGSLILLIFFHDCYQWC